MLIRTERHTLEDLALWDEYESADALHAVADRKIEQSVEEIRRWAMMHPGLVYACTSWGKDSVVLCYLIAMCGIRIPVVYMRFDDRANPDCNLVRDEFLAMFEIDYHERVFSYNDVRKSGKHWKSLSDEFGGYRITGIRNDESGKRGLIYKMFGMHSERSCRPLSLWTNQDVFSYLCHNSLPVNPAYGYLGAGRWRRDRLRTHSLAGSSGDGIGRREWESEYYGDLIRRIEKNS